MTRCLEKWLRDQNCVVLAINKLLIVLKVGAVVTHLSFLVAQRGANTRWQFCLNRRCWRYPAKGGRRSYERFQVREVTLLLARNDFFSPLHLVFFFLCFSSRNKNSIQLFLRSYPHDSLRLPWIQRRPTPNFHLLLFHLTIPTP